MKHILYYYNSLFVSACSLSILVKAKGKPYEIAYWWISFLIGINLVSLLMLIKFFVGFNIEVNRSIFVIVFFLPPFIFNYYLFLRKRKYIKLLGKIKRSAKGFICYVLLTLLFFIVTGYINIP